MTTHETKHTLGRHYYALGRIMAEDQDHTVLAQVYPTGAGSRANVEQDANGKLYAAAPLMLEALEEAHTLLCYCADGEPMGTEAEGKVWDFERVERAIQLARAALRAARGER